MAINLNHDTDTITATSGTLNLPNFSGGGLTHFVESESTASPNATVPVDALTATDAGYTNLDVAIVAKGTGATLAQVPDGTVAGGNKRGTYATDWQKNRQFSSYVASGQYSTIGGGYRNLSSSYSTTVAGGDGNEATNFNSTIGGGSFNTASGQYAYVGGGSSNTASSSYSFVGGGESNAALSNTHATVCGGNGNTASGQYSFVGGGRRGTTRSITGYHVFPACSAPIANTAGVTQSALLLLGRQTTDATTTVLTSDTSAASTTNQVILPNNAAYSFSGEVIAGVTGAGDTARWTINGAIKRGASAATTAMVGTPTVTMTHNDAGASGWTVAVTADTTNGGISVTVTGAASTTIRWVAKLNTTEMSY